jgi:putative methionine-R-sulfoxide reductase with GAF domain
MSSGPIEGIERLIAATEDADDVLRGAVSTLLSQSEVDWAGIAFVEGGAITLGPAAGTPDEVRRTRVPVVFHDALVGELWADGDNVDEALLAQVAQRIAPYVLIGWDTGGESWEP